MAADAEKTAADYVPPHLRAWRCRRCVALFLAVTIVWLVTDLVTKRLAFRHVASEPVVVTADGRTNLHAVTQPKFGRTLVPGVLSLKLTVNHGAVFGLGQGRRWVFVLVSVAAIGIIARVFARSPRTAVVQHVALAMILAGALGNLYDRIRFSAVRDLLYLFPGIELPLGLAWPGGNRELYPWIFNVADVALVVGVITLLILMWRKPTPAPDDESGRG